jgi:hypothetical protein
VCQDWANTKAAYRFLDNDRVSEAQILAGHFEAARDRFEATDGPILVLHDTTEFSFKRGDVDAVGITRKCVAGAYRDGAIRYYAACGILMHSSLAVTTEGLPLGLAAIKFWNRQKFKGTNALKKKINPTRVPIEEKESIRWLDNLRQPTTLLGDPARCVHIGDHESDIYELFCTAQDAGTHFLLRTCVDRLAGDGTHTIAAEMEEVRCKGLHRVQVLDRKGNPSEAILELKFRRVRVLPPIGPSSRYQGDSLLNALAASIRADDDGLARIVACRKSLVRLRYGSEGTSLWIDRIAKNNRWRRTIIAGIRGIDETSAWINGQIERHSPPGKRPQGRKSPRYGVAGKTLELLGKGFDGVRVSCVGRKTEPGGVAPGGGKRAADNWRERSRAWVDGQGSDRIAVGEFVIADI